MYLIRLQAFMASLMVALLPSCIKYSPEEIRLEELSGIYSGDTYENESLELRKNLTFFHKFRGKDEQNLENEGTFANLSLIEGTWYMSLTGFYSKNDYDEMRPKVTNSSSVFEVYKKMANLFYVIGLVPWKSTTVL